MNKHIIIVVKDVRTLMDVHKASLEKVQEEMDAFKSRMLGDPLSQKENV